MRKIAFIVEGQTEQLFVRKLLGAVVRPDDICISDLKITGGKRDPRMAAILPPIEDPTGKKYYAEIYDSCGYARVLSDIREKYNDLSDSGYEMIIGLRDLDPVRPEDEHILYESIAEGIPVGKALATIIVAKREVESWFIGEHTHYARFHRALNIESIENVIGYRPDVHDVENILKPSNDLKKIYNIVGRPYNKRRISAIRTINVLDYNELYLSLPLHQRMPSLAKLIEVIAEFFSVDYH